MVLVTAGLDFCLGGYNNISRWLRLLHAPPIVVLCVLSHGSNPFVISVGRNHRQSAAPQLVGPTYINNNKSLCNFKSINKSFKIT